jgi:hypothetical protein
MSEELEKVVAKIQKRLDEEGIKRVSTQHAIAMKSEQLGSSGLDPAYNLVRLAIVALSGLIRLHLGQLLRHLLMLFNLFIELSVLDKSISNRLINVVFVGSRRPLYCRIIYGR